MSLTSRAVPVMVLGGYLGAGKTTLVNRLLRADHGRRLTVLVNDFGQINVDASLIASHDGQTISLTNGCICCSIAGDLGSALRDAAATKPAPDQILVEASGVADPGRIANFARGWQELTLAGVITLVDPLTVRERSADKFVGVTVKRQLKSANRLYMTKTDLIGNTDREQVLVWLQNIAPGIAIFRSDAPGCAGATRDGDPIDWTVLLETLPINEQADEMGQAPAVSHQFVSCLWRPTGVVNAEQLRNALTAFEPSILRCKGWLPVRGNTPGLQLLQMVGRQITLTEPACGQAPAEPGLSLILRHDGRLREALFTRLNACCD